MKRLSPLVLFVAEALFLGVMSLFGLVADIASYARGAGPYGAVFLDDPQVIGVIEAHGLALLTGIAAAVIRNSPNPYWHVHFAGVHLLLGGANIAFFQVFVITGLEPMGVVVTIVHFLFAGAQLGVFATRKAAGVA